MLLMLVEKTADWSRPARVSLLLATLVALGGLSTPSPSAWAVGSAAPTGKSVPPRGRFIEVDEPSATSGSKDQTVLPPGIVPGTVGTMNGAISIGESGSVAWSTSLKLVPGVGGMEPTLAISYEGGGYGALGIGFSLEGADSSISRCRRTLGRDERHAPIDWTIEDRLCLDGARLDAKIGEYGAPGTEYVISSSPNLRIVGSASSVDEVSGFEVHSPDGRVSYYGLNQTAMQWAQLSGKKVPFSWHLVRVVDRRSGNQMTYEYAGEAAAGDGHITPSDFRLMSLSYGLNSVASAPASRRVTFEYDPVQEVISEIIQGDLLPGEPEAWIHQGYVSGQSYAARQTLRRVLVEYLDETQEWQPVRSYRLGYELVPSLNSVPLTWYKEPPVVAPTDENGNPLPLPPPEVPVKDEPRTSDRVRLAALQECAPPPSHAPGSRPCFWPTRFEWSSLSDEYQPMAGFGWDGTPFYPLPKIKDIETQPYLGIGAQVLADLDGDGDLDMFVMPEPMNAVAIPHVSWEFWETDANVHHGVATNIGAWSTQPWTNRAGTVVPAVGSVRNPYFAEPRLPEPVRVGHLKDKNAAQMAWPMNYDGTGGTDVLIGEPVLELAGATIDAPWGLASQTVSSRYPITPVPFDPYEDLGPCSLTQPTPKEYWECMDKERKDFLQSPADYTGHPGFMRDLAVVSLEQKATGANPVAQLKKTSLGYKDGRPILWAQILDMNGDSRDDVMFCKADADYAAVAGQAIPMFYGAGGEFDPVNWVSGTLHYKFNEPGSGIDLSEGGFPATTHGFGSEPVLCHAKDTYLVMDLDGDGTQSLLHRVHPHVGRKLLSGITRTVPEGMVLDPFPKSTANDDEELTTYWPKLREKIYAEHPIGEVYYRALTFRGAKGMQYEPTTLPFEQFMVWQQNPGNREARYSTHQAALETDVDGGVSDNAVAYGMRDGRLTDWGTPDAPMIGGPSGLRTGDINGDGLMDVLMVDLQSCYWGQHGPSPEDKPDFKTRTCSFQDVMEFGVELIEQTYEKLAVFTYLNRGDGSFELVPDGGLRLWDTDVTAQGAKVLEGIYTGLPGIEYDQIYRQAWTSATQAARAWRMEFSSSFIGDGNGDGLADLGYLRTKFEPNGGWYLDSMAGIYRLYPVWRLGRHGGGLSVSETRMGLDLHKAVPEAMGTGFPGWKPDVNQTRWGNAQDSSAVVDVYEQQDHGLSARLVQMDVDKDGRPELAFYDHVRGRYRLVTLSPTEEPQPHLLTAVSDGLGARSEVDYAPQWTLTTPSTPWTQSDIDVKYPLYRRPSVAPAVARLRLDTGQDAGDAPRYVTTSYRYGKTTSDVRRGISLGIERSESMQSVSTPSGLVHRTRLTRYDTSNDYDLGFKAYPLAGALLSETVKVWGEGEDAISIEHSGHRYSAHAGKAAATWRRLLDSSSITGFEMGSDVPPDASDSLFACLVNAYDAASECKLGDEMSYQPLTHGTTSFAYDAENYGLLKTQIVESGGTTAVTETQFQHHDPANLATPVPYLLGLPTVVWTAHEPAPGDGFVVQTSLSAYDAMGRLSSITSEPDRAQYRFTTSYTYDDFGHVKTSAVSAAGIPDNTMTYGYSASGAYPTTTVNALGHTTTTRWYEGCGLPEQVTNALGQTQVNDIDLFCRDKGSQAFFGDVPLSRKTFIDYLEWEPNADEGYADKEIWMKSGIVDGAVSSTISNRIGQVMVNQGPAFGFDAYTQTRYDDLGRMDEVSLPTKVGGEPIGWTTTSYDSQNRVVGVTKPDGTMQTTLYARSAEHPRHYLTVSTDELGNSGTTEVDDVGQIVRVIPPADPESPETDLSMCYAYGAFGVLVEATPCVENALKGSTTLTYDDYGRLTSSHDNQAGLRRTRYDALGRVQESEDALGQITRMRYDVVGRMIGRTQAYGTPEAKTAAWAYDDLAPGILTQAVNGEKSVIEQPLLDDYNRVVGSVATIHGRTYTRRHSFDAWGRIASQSYPSLSLLAPVTTYNQYNDLDQPVALSYQGQTLWEPIAADVWGLTEQHYGKGTLQAYTTRDSLTGRLQDAQTVRQAMVNGQPEKVLLEHFSYDWYDNGLIRQRTQKALTAQANDQADQFQYSPRGELRSWSTIGANHTLKHGAMSYDGFGNITNSPSGDFTYSNEKLLTIQGPLGQLSYTYDDNGRVISRSHPGGETKISYNALNQVSSIASPMANQVITYSADGQKVHARDKATGRETYYLGDYQEERGGGLGQKGLVIGRYALGAANLTRTWTEADLGYNDVLSYTPPADHLGSTTLVTDTEGFPTDRRSYDTWGNERESGNWNAFKAAPVDDVVNPPSGYTGHHERKQFGATAPGVSGIVDMQARYYDPTAMRFLQPDTIIPDVFSPIDWNRLTYVGNSPTNFSDPTGRAQQAAQQSSHSVDANGNSILSGNRPDDCINGDCYKGSQGMLQSNGAGAPSGVEAGEVLSNMRIVKVARNAIKVLEDAAEARRSRGRAADCMACVKGKRSHSAEELNELYQAYLQYYDQGNGPIGALTGRSFKFTSFADFADWYTNRGGELAVKTWNDVRDAATTPTGYTPAGAGKTAGKVGLRLLFAKLFGKGEKAAAAAKNQIVLNLSAHLANNADEIVVIGGIKHLQVSGVTVGKIFDFGGQRGIQLVLDSAYQSVDDIDAAFGFLAKHASGMRRHTLTYNFGSDLAGARNFAKKVNTYKANASAVASRFGVAENSFGASIESFSSGGSLIHYTNITLIRE